MNPKIEGNIPADQGLQQYSTGINKKYGAPVFENLAILNGDRKDANTGVTKPSEADVARAKDWVDENRL